MGNEGFYYNKAILLPAKIRKSILENNYIDKATNTDQTKTPMELLFDFYEIYFDPRGEHDDWHCHLCRAHILSEWQKIKPHLITLENQ